VLRRVKVAGDVMMVSSNVVKIAIGSFFRLYLMAGLASNKYVSSTK
jgi:hypothetical protein